MRKILFVLLILVLVVSGCSVSKSSTDLAIENATSVLKTTFTVANEYVTEHEKQELMNSYHNEMKNLIYDDFYIHLEPVYMTMRSISETYNLDIEIGSMEFKEIIEDEDGIFIDFDVTLLMKSEQKNEEEISISGQLAVSVLDGIAKSKHWKIFMGNVVEKYPPQ
ncbi:MAG: hypothetical protein U9Q80_05770 [Bacillota bacterium]|nr:hypothetical protein [Bacillota bacterium]